MNYNARDKIISTANRLVKQYGYEAITVNKIIEESGTSKGSFYYHFPNGKDDVVLEVLRIGYARSVEGSKSILARHNNLEEAFSQLIDVMIHDIQNGKHEDLMFPSLSVIALEASNNSPAITEECNKIYAALRKVFSERLLQSGCYTPDEAQCLGTLIQAAFGGAVVSSYASKSIDALVALKNSLYLVLRNTK